MSRGPVIEVCRLPHGEDLPLPSYETAGAAGADLRAAIAEDQSPMPLPPGARAMVPTGLTMAIPEGYEVQVRPRSGLAAKFGITCLNSPGTVDWDYRGELRVILYNSSNEEFLIERGMRIAQMIVAPVVQAGFEEVGELSETVRGTGGFGSTGQ
ncbi:dUTP diphosphatase [Parvularcula marina]|uniref:dUTP diphosphatase n=1 Tax=Parvularcula marina TaxID=2292771 RepID=UPI00351468FB